MDGNDNATELLHLTANTPLHCWKPRQQSEYDIRAIEAVDAMMNDDEFWKKYT